MSRKAVALSMQGKHVQSWAHDSWRAMRDALHDGTADDVVRSHGVSFAAAAVALIVSLLLVHRQDHSSMLSGPMPKSLVSPLVWCVDAQPIRAYLLCELISQTEAEMRVETAVHLHHRRFSDTSHRP